MRPLWHFIKVNLKIVCRWIQNANIPCVRILSFAHSLSCRGGCDLDQTRCARLVMSEFQSHTATVSLACLTFQNAGMGFISSDLYTVFECFLAWPFLHHYGIICNAFWYLSLI